MSQSSGRNIFVFDSDPHVTEMIAQYSPKDKVESVEDAELFLEKIYNFAVSPDFFVIDWAYNGDISGPGLVSRLKSDPELSTVPILILFGHESTQVTMIDEFFTVSSIQKPLREKDYKKAVHELFKEKNWSNRHYRMIADLINDRKDDIEPVVAQFIKILAQAPNPIPLGKLVATRLFQTNYHRMAEKVLLKILSIDPNNITALNILGKIYCKTKRKSKAYHLLKRADILSPNNVERICLLGKIELSNQECAAAQRSFIRASELDPTDVRVRLGLRISRSLEDQAADCPVSYSGAYASLMNTLAITRANRGEIAEACIYYNLALDSLDCPVLKSKVMFNVGLGYLKKNDLDNAEEWFLSSQTTGAEKFTRSSQYILKIETQRSGNSQIIDLHDIEMEDLDFIRDEEGQT